MRRSTRLQGLCRNAADKAFQAWKELLAAIVVDYGHVLAERFKGVEATSENKRISLADSIHAHGLCAGGSQGD